MQIYEWMVSESRSEHLTCRFCLGPHHTYSLRGRAVCSRVSGELIAETSELLGRVFRMYEDFEQSYSGHPKIGLSFDILLGSTQNVG